MGYSFRLTAKVLLYAPSHRQDSTYHGLSYTRRGALAGMRNSSMDPPHEGSIRRPITPWANALTTELHLAPSGKKRIVSRERFMRNMLGVSISAITYRILSKPILTCHYKGLGISLSTTHSGRIDTCAWESKNIWDFTVCPEGNRTRMFVFPTLSPGCSHVFLPGFIKKEGNVLFNDTLNTFYLRLYGARHMG